MITMPMGDPWPWNAHPCACTLPYQHCCGRFVQQQAHPQGCVCPPGSEATCQGVSCPRRNPFVSGFTASPTAGAP